MTILAGKTLIQCLINLFRARQSLGEILRRQDDRMLDDIGLTRAELGREIGTWQDRAELRLPEPRRPRAPAPSTGGGLAGLSLPRATIFEALMLRRAA